MLHMIVNEEKWNSLPKQYQSILDQAGAAAGSWLIEKYDSVNPRSEAADCRRGGGCARFRSRSWRPATTPPQTIRIEIAEKSPIFKNNKESHNACMKEVLFYTQIAEN